MKRTFTKYILIIIFIMFSVDLLLSAETYEKYINSNWGTDFTFTVPPALIEMGNSNSNYVRLFISSDVETEATISISGKGYSNTVLISAGKSSEIALTPELAQPYVKTALDPIFQSDIYEKSAINISSESPIVVYALVNYSSTSEGFTLIPNSLQSNEYIISSYGDASIYYPPYSGFPSLCGISAIYDRTEIYFKLGGNSTSQTSSGQKSGEIVKKTLNKGDVWMISSRGRDADLSGSLISSNLPISVVSGSYSANIPSENKYSGYLVEMELATKFWGQEFHIPSIMGRKYSSIVRIYAKENDTKISLNGNFVANIEEKGGILGKGYLELRISDLISTNYGAITSDKPISITMYNTGSEEDGLPEPPGSPFQILLNPVENYLKDAFFSLPSAHPENSFQSNYLNIIYDKEPEDKIPYSLEIGKFINGSFMYLPLNSYDIVHKVELQGNKKYTLITLKLDPIANYHIKSNVKFTAYLYGFNQNSSYGFSAGLNASLLDNLDSIPPQLSWNINCDGNVSGFAYDLPDDDTRSNLAGSMYLNEDSYNFKKGKFDNIISGISQSAEWNLNVVNPELDAKAVLIFWDLAGNTSRAEVVYRANNNRISSKYENFGSFKKGDAPRTKKFNIKNKSDSVSIITNINLKEGDSNFEIIGDLVFPIVLEQDSSYVFEVKFTPNESGLILDSLGFGDDCKFKYTTLLEAVVGNPIIEVSDISFDDLTIGATLVAQSKIQNNGVSDLIITGYEKPINSDFEVIFDTFFDENNPLIIPAGEEYYFSVKFTPSDVMKYKDSIIIKSDANVNDSICVIRARSIEPGLVAGSYDWERKRIFRPNYPAGPYTIENDNNSITLQNTGNTEILINGIEIVNELNSDAFEFNRQVFNNLKLKAGEKYSYKVQFRPTQIGEHNLSIRYKTDFEGNSTITELRGFGTVPKINTQIVDFDTVVVEDYENASIRKIQITNLASAEWIYYDTLYIYDFELPNIDEISDDWVNYGLEGFKIDKRIIDFPIKLAPGKSFQLYSGFVPYREGENSSQINIISDAIDEASVILKGFGVNQQITFLGGSAEACLGNEKIIRGLIKNNSSQEMNFSSLKFDNDINDFRLLDKNLEKGFSLAPAEQKNIDVIYSPIELSEKSINLIISDAKTNYKRIAEFTGKAIEYKANIYSTPTQVSANINDTINQKFTFRTNDNLSDIGLNKLDFVINYNSSTLKYLHNLLKISSDLDGTFTINLDEARSKNGVLVFNLKSITNREIIGDVELFEIAFELYYPNDMIDNLDIIFEAQPINNECVDIEGSRARVNVNPVCGDDLRIFNFSNYKYSLSDIAPSPVSNNQVNLGFTIGISAYTELSIYNSNGMLIENIVSSHLEQGNYEKSIDLTKYSSGLYFYTIKSGPFIEKKKFIISK